MPQKLFLFLSIALLFLAASACKGAPSATQDAAIEDTPTTPAEVQDLVSWYQYDQNNEDPASDERVGNAYLRKTISQFNKEFTGKWNWINQPKAFDKMIAELVAAVQSGADVPDIYIIFNNQSIVTFHRHGTLQDLSEWAQTQPWFKDLDPNALQACKGPDGKLYCIPIAERPQLVYVWKDYFPSGYPQTPAEFMTEAKRLKNDGVYAITFFGSTDKGGTGFTRAIWATLASFGGAIDDGQGNMQLDTPENIAAIEFLRQIVAKGYVPEVAFAGGFQEEEAFKDASAASFPTGLFGYRYLNPLTAPNGKQYAKGNAEDVPDAVAAGDMTLSPFLAAAGQKPGCNIGIAGLAIPVGAKNVAGAHDYINWLMSPAQNADWVTGPGGGFPALQSARSAEVFQSPFYQQAARAVEASACRPWHGSLERPQEAQALIMRTVYKLIKEDPTANIADTLIQAQDEYNSE